LRPQLVQAEDLDLETLEAFGQQEGAIQRHRGKAMDVLRDLP
jgi:hypothetical protein